MKFFIAALSLLAATVSTAVVDEPVTTTVEITVKCKKVKLAHLGLEEQLFSAKALRNAYNEVHQKLDNGDYYLFDVKFEVSDDEHAALSSPLRQGGSGGNYGGGWGCELCGDADEAFFRNAAADTAWQNLFTAKLNEGHFADLKDAESCDIKMKAKGGVVYDTEQLEEQLAEPATVSDGVAGVQMAVSIKVTCSGLNYNKLSELEEGYSAEMLEEAYNEVHGAIARDDGTLSGTHYTGPAGMTAGPLRGALQQGGSGGNYGGGWTCELCGDDNEMLEWPWNHHHDHKKEETAAQKAWESSFVSKLLEGPSCFHGVSHCNINMKPVAIPVLDTVTSE